MDQHILTLSGESKFTITIDQRYGSLIIANSMWTNTLTNNQDKISQKSQNSDREDGKRIKSARKKKPSLKAPMDGS